MLLLLNFFSRQTTPYSKHTRASLSLSLSIYIYIYIYIYVAHFCLFIFISKYLYIWLISPSVFTNNGSSFDLLVLVFLFSRHNALNFQNAVTSFCNVAVRSLTTHCTNHSTKTEKTGKSKEGFICSILLGTPTHVHHRVGQTVWNYTYHLCSDIRCSLKDRTGVMDDYD